jgi:signal transduction histidine kinase
VPLTGADGQPRGAIGAVVDITTRKEAEARLITAERREQAARREAEAANRSKDEFLAMLGHELRNPLNAIASAAEVLNRLQAGGDTAAAAREIIARQTRRRARTGAASAMTPPTSSG